MLKEGDVIELERDHGSVYANVPEYFLYHNRKGSWKIARGRVSLSSEPWLCGRYIVYKTTMEGGGHGPDGDYSNGHHVFCRKAPKNATFADEEHLDGLEIDFYQSGCFTAMIEDIEPIGRAELRYEISLPNTAMTPGTTILEKHMNPLEQLLTDNADEQNTRQGILNSEEVEAIEEAIVIGRKVDEMYASRNEQADLEKGGDVISQAE